MLKSKLVKRKKNYRQNLLRKLIDDQYLINQLFGSFSGALGVIDTEGHIKYMSESINSVIGFSGEEVIGKNIFNRIHPSSKNLFRNKISECICIKQTQLHFKYIMQHKDGSLRDVEVIMSNQIDEPSIGGLLIFARDRTDFERIQKRAFFFENIDSISGLPNRESFIKSLKREIIRAESRGNLIAVLSLRLNKFQNINDIYGPDAGCCVLKEIGERLKATFREDDLVCRYEGAMFMAILADVHEIQNAALIFQKVENALSEPLRIQNDFYSITAAMGICFYPQDGYDADALINNSINTMNNVMDKSRTAYALFDKKRSRKMLNLMKIERDLQDALKNEEFFVYFQPKVNHKNVIVGMEALVRWKSPSRGIVTPDVFIPIAEKNGLIEDIDRFVLLTVCEQISNWRENGLPIVPVAVNISAKELNSENLVSDIKSTLERTDVDPCWLEIEITESALMDNRKNGIEDLLQLKEMGVVIAVDDFGTGYSSLSRLRDYPVDVLKIDKSFVDDIPFDRRASILTKNIINLAHDLDFKVVSEGVENRRQFEYLKDCGCEHFQGYYFYKPAAAEDLSEFNKLEKGIVG